MAGTGRRAAALDLGSRLPLVRPRLTVDPGLLGVIT